MTDIIEVEARQSAALLDLRPAEMVARASEIANVLKDVIEQQNLFSVIGPNKHVKAEGWATLGSMLNILPKERQVIEHNDGSFEAYVDLINMKTGMVVGGGSALCGMDEARWKKADRYARRSMAITRATGKAYRLCFAWVMALAGYNTTPAEEMPVVETVTKRAAEPAQPKPYTGTDAQKALLAQLFDKHGIVGEDRKRIHNSFLESKILCPDEMEAGVLELKIEIPFGG